MKRTAHRGYEDGCRLHSKDDARMGRSGRLLFYAIKRQKSLECICITTKDWKSSRIGLLGLVKEQLQGFLIHPQKISGPTILHTYIIIFLHKNYGFIN